MDDVTCPACNQIFFTRQAKNSHLKQKETCKWFKRGKLPAGVLERDDIEVVDEASEEEAAPRRTRRTTRMTGRNMAATVEEDVPMRDEVEGDEPLVEDVLDDIPDYTGDLFHFMNTVQPPEPEVEIGEAGPGPQTQARRAAAYNHRVLAEEDDDRVIVENLEDGVVIKMADTLYERWKGHFSTKDPQGVTEDDSDDSEDSPMADGTNNTTLNPYIPFASKLDWQIADWMVQNQPGHKAFDRLLSIPGVVEKLGLSYHNSRGMHQCVDQMPEVAGKWRIKNLHFPDKPEEVFTVRYRDPVEAVKSLWGDPTLAKHLVYRPKKIFSSPERDNQVYNEMWTGDLWHKVQGKLPKGATIAQVILATDKTQLTLFSGSKAAYPVYLTLGNIPCAIRRKPSMHACVLIGYLSCDKIDKKNLTDDDRRSRIQKLFHESMQYILKPLKEVGKNGMEMTGGDGCVRRVHPILACYAADYPEQVLVTCSKYKMCPKCQCPHDMLHDKTPKLSRTQKWTLNVIKEGLAAQQAHRPSGNTKFREHCASRNVSAGTAYRPFWEGLPYCDIHLAMAPDVLHQLYQGVFAHIVRWCRRLMTDKQLDSRLKCLPRGYGVTHFKKGWSTLSQISGLERKNMAKVLLGCLIGVIPKRGIRAIRSLLDFIYLAQYTTHDTITLQYMQEALDTFQSNKDFFVDVSVRSNLNIPKFHSLLHYIESIKLLGTTNNYNTEMFERFHIDFAKEGYRASNKRDTFPQMILWLSRREKMHTFHQYLLHTTDIEPPAPDDGCEQEPPPHVNSLGIPLLKPHNPVVPESVFFNGNTTYHITKWPAFPRQPVLKVMQQQHAPGLDMAIKDYLNAFLFRPERAQALGYRVNPVDRIDVFSQFKLTNPTDDELVTGVEPDVIKAHRTLKQYDTVIVMVRDDAESTGLQGTRVGRVRVIFRLPQFIQKIPVPKEWPKVPLVYIEWYSPLERAPQHDSHLMYKLKKLDNVTGTIVPITHIRQSSMLYPMFSKYKNADMATWTHENVLDKCSHFLINNWASRSAYKTIY